MDDEFCKCGKPIVWHTESKGNLVTDGLCMACEMKVRKEQLRDSEMTVEKLIAKLQMLDPKKKVYSNDDEYGPWAIREVTEDVVDGEDVILLD